MLASKVVCPHCRAVLKSSRSLPAGKPLSCPRCGVSFALGVDQSPTAPPLSDQQLPARVRWKPLLAILLGGLVVLGGGIYLAVLCFSDDKPAEEPKPVVKKPTTGEDAEPDDAPEQDKGKPAKKPALPAAAPQGPRSFLTPAQKAQVKQTLDRGVVFLKTTQKRDGSWGQAKAKHEVGITALAGLTLLECAVPKNDPVIQNAAAFLRRRDQSAQKINQTYEIALTILFLVRLDDSRDGEMVRQLTLRLVAGQGPSGGWTYPCPVLTADESSALAALLKQNEAQLNVIPGTGRLEMKALDHSKLTLGERKVVPARITHLAVWQKDTVARANKAQRSDNSNTQFAILALWAVKDRDVPVQRSLALIVKRFRKGQNRDGSWGYNATGTKVVSNYPTMTCAGLLGLAVGLGLANEAQDKGQARKPADQDPAVRRGLERVAKSVGEPAKSWRKAKEAPLLNLYFLWSVERVGVIFNLSKIGGKDWYGWGAERLVATQTVQGNRGFWERGDFSGQNRFVNTCFGLLFLQRANLAKDLTSKLTLDQ